MSLKKQYPYYIANKAVVGTKFLPVLNKFTNEVATEVSLASSVEIDEAIAAATAAMPAMRKMASYDRKAVLQHVAKRMTERKEELAQALCIEAGKPIKDSRGEVERAIITFTVASEESVRIHGDYLSLDDAPRNAGFSGITRKFPIGPVSMISPFNFPINLAAHKVAPALAVGCPFVLKPASRTPIGALIIGEILAECPQLPPGAFSVLPCSRDGADLLTVDDRIKLLSFTGSPEVGWDLKARAGKKKVVLELGGNAAAILDKDTDVDHAVDRCIVGGYYQSGQSCIGIQRILVHESIHEEFRAKFVARVENLVHGDPSKEDTFVGPIIAESEAARIQTWIDEAVAAGAKVLAGGSRDGCMVRASVLENVPVDQKLQCEEVFGPVVVMDTFTDIRDAIASVNHSRFGLQAGIFSRDIRNVFYAFEELEVGGLVVNDVPSVRVDAQPYGGVKDSGFGREGLVYAMDDMMEERILLMKNINQL